MIATTGDGAAVLRTRGIIMMMPSVVRMPNGVVQVVDGVEVSVPSPVRRVPSGVPIIRRIPPPRVAPSVVGVPVVIIPTIRPIEGVPWVGVNVNVFRVVRAAHNRDAGGMEAHNAVGERLGFRLLLVKRLSFG